MPFDSKTASTAGKIGGRRGAAKRWGNKDPVTIRNKSLRLVVTHEEFDMMNVKAAAEGISRTELIVRAVRRYKSESKNTLK